MHFLALIIALILLVVFWRAFAFLAIIIAVGVAIFIVANQSKFDAVPTAQLAAMGLAPRDDTTDATVCNPTRDRALRASDSAVLSWAQRHPCPAAGDPKSASSQTVAKAWIDTMASEIAAQQRAAAQQVQQQAAHEAARPKECVNWKPVLANVDANGVPWLARANLEHAKQCAAWEASAAMAVNVTGCRGVGTPPSECTQTRCPPGRTTRGVWSRPASGRPSGRRS